MSKSNSEIKFRFKHESHDPIKTKYGWDITDEMKKKCLQTTIYGRSVQIMLQCIFQHCIGFHCF